LGFRVLSGVLSIGSALNTLILVKKRL